MRRSAQQRIGVAAGVAAAVCLTMWAVADAESVRRAVDAVLVRYGAVWVALAGVVVLGLVVSWRPAARRRVVVQEAARPHLTLVSSERS